MLVQWRAGRGGGEGGGWFARNWGTLPVSELVS